MHIRFRDPRRSQVAPNSHKYEGCDWYIQVSACYIGIDCAINGDNFVLNTVMLIPGNNMSATIQL